MEFNTLPTRYREMSLGIMWRTNPQFQGRVSVDHVGLARFIAPVDNSGKPRRGSQVTVGAVTAIRREAQYLAPIVTPICVLFTPNPSALEELWVPP